MPVYGWPGVSVYGWPGVPVYGWPGVPVYGWPGVPVYGWPGVPVYGWPGGGYGWSGWPGMLYGWFPIHSGSPPAGCALGSYSGGNVTEPHFRLTCGCDQPL